MKVSRVNSSGRALPEAAGADAVALATGVSAATEVAAEEAAGAEAATEEPTGVSAATEVGAAERTAEAEAVGVAMPVLLETGAETEGAEPPEPALHVAIGPPGAV